jgi:hypothetical protein
MEQKYYVTKYWNTDGIYQIAGKLEPLQSNSKIGGKTHRLVVDYKLPKGGYLGTFYGKEYWLTKEEAIAHVGHLRENQIRLLEKKVSKLKAMVVDDLIIVPQQ